MDTELELKLELHVTNGEAGETFADEEGCRVEEVWDASDATVVVTFDVTTEL